MAVIALTIGAIGGCSKTSSPTAPAALAAGETAVKGDPGLGPELGAVRDATNQFHDVNVAIAAGYASPEGGHCDASPAGTMGIHSPKMSLLQTQALDPLQPEVMLYLPKPGGGFRLVAVEYVQFVLLRNPATGQVAPWASPSPWPAEYEVVTPTPHLFGQTFQGPMAGHVPGMPWHWDLHTWIWAHNPSGTFAQWNPSISCE
jgi:hypothetical protein